MLSPVLIFFIYIMVINLHNSVPVEVFDSRQQNHTQILEQFDKGSDVVFAPSTNFTRHLMNSVARSLNYASPEFKSFQTYIELYSYLLKPDTSTDNIMAIIFTAGYISPSVCFTYIMKSYKMDITEKIYMLQQEYEPNSDCGYFNDYIMYTYLPLKMAIDLEYLKMISNFSMNFILQEFPDVVKRPSELDQIYPLITELTIGGYLFCTFVVYQILEEKKYEIRTLLKTMGMQPWIEWIGWFLDAFLINLFSVFIVTILLTIPLWKGAIAPLEHVNTLMLFSFLLLYVISEIMFCLAISPFFNKPLFGQISGMVLWLLTYVYSNMAYTSTVWISYTFFGIFPNAVLDVGYKMIDTFGRLKFNLNWDNISEILRIENVNISFGKVFQMLAVNSVFYFTVALIGNLFLDSNQPIHIRKKMLSTHRNKIDLERRKSSTLFSIIQEGQSLPVGIQIQNVTKHYRDVVAVNNLSIDVYKGQITVLLGPNGSGKTTIIKIVTGILTPSSGEVFVSGLNVQYNLAKIRNYLGFCPQEQLLFPNLSIKEQFVLYGMLKGLSRLDAQADTQKLLRKFNVYKQRNMVLQQLSEGTKQKIAIAVALIGNPEVLVLDEPTSGLDLESRLTVWKLLLSVKESRTILFSTHDMEEAETLGDQIAIINNGALICYGTYEYLKKKFGSNYKLSVTFNSKEKDAYGRIKVIEIIQQEVPNAELTFNIGYNAIFSFPLESKPSLSTVFKILEDSIVKFEIVNVRLSIDTMENLYNRVNDRVTRTTSRQGAIEADSIRLLGEHFY